MSLSFLWKWKCRWRYLKYGLVFRPDFLVVWSTSWYRNHSSIIQKLRSRNDSCTALTMETWIISPWLSWAGAYVPSLFQRLLNHTSISGEGPNWRNILFKFNVCWRWRCLLEMMVLAVQRQITSQRLVLKIMFHKSISYTYCIAPRKKYLLWLLLSIWMWHDLDKKLKKKAVFLILNH